MKGHIKRLSIFLLYTLVFNTISIGAYVVQNILFHDSESIGWAVFGIAQVCFTILFFNKVPLPTTTNKKDIKTDLLVYFLILCVLSALALIDIGTIFSSPNTYTFLLPFHFEIKTIEICANLLVFVIENALKTFLIYTNISKKKLSKPICIILGVIMIIAYIIFLFLLAKGGIM